MTAFATVIFYIWLRASFRFYGDVTRVFFVSGNCHVSETEVTNQSLIRIVKRFARKIRLPPEVPRCQ
jgi:hypothetical protein